ncbi:DHHA1 domain-containing protein [Fredinandcohnia sp. QZ13]|uniref:alanyl-tRNA editing protein n=1 Tax=Fredinandcohnia sp. QZ13 TaxID=3073144 RepID=UPI00285325F4|nr:DHHA1 domain-containing protein [Fredinandcohnia sp. QZ13]MDR4886368.1 DHHA1 domain-containing protein [Fredinandcohnia sp. QZ13]
MTKKLYYENPYLTNWTTEVTNMIKKDDYCLITLKETAFYPEGGGQPSDTGLIGNIKVLDVYQDAGEVYHKLPHPPENKVVECQIDWDLRYDHMQQHTGQHLLSAICIEEYDAHTSSFHLGKDTVSIDLSVPEFSEDQLLHIENKVNKAIYENQQIKTYFVTKQQASSLPLRKMPDVEGNEMRIVEIEGYDTSACAGTHVSRTGELGLMKLLKTEKSKGNTRVYFIFGSRALHDYQATHSVLTTLNNKYSTNSEGLIEKISKIEMENKQYQREIEELKGKLNQFLAQELIQTHTEPIIIQNFEDKSLKELQGIAKQINEASNQCVIFTSTLENKLLISHNGSVPVQCGQLFKLELKNYHGKGGGNNTTAQAAFDNERDLEVFKTFLETKILEAI